MSPVPAQLQAVVDAVAPHLTTPVLAGSALALLLTLLAMAMGIGRGKTTKKRAAKAPAKAKAAPAKALASPKPKASAAKAAAAADDDVRRSARCGGNMRHFSKPCAAFLGGADGPGACIARPARAHSESARPARRWSAQTSRPRLPRLPRHAL